MTTPLRGREHVLGEISRALDDASGGRSRMVLVTGEPGIGKTALAWEAARLARQRRMDVAWGACLDADLASLFAPWLEILGPEGAASVVDAGASSSAGTDPQEAEWRRGLAFHTVVEQLQSRAVAAGLLVVLEDLHWAGTPSQLLLRYVVAHLGAVGRVVLLGTCRDAELDPVAPLAAMVTGVDRLELSGLDDKAVGDLLADLTDEPVAARVAAELRRATGGNPFFVAQLARLGVDRAVRLPEIRVPAEVEAVLARRLAASTIRPSEYSAPPPLSASSSTPARKIYSRGTRVRNRHRRYVGVGRRQESSPMPIEQLRRCLETGDWDRLADVYAPAALLDANVPQWRFQREGVEEIVAQYRDWYPEAVRLVEWMPISTTFGAVVEQAEWTVVGGEDTYTRSVHLLHFDGGRIVRHVLYCTGRWNRTTVERHRLEAPLYET